MKNQTQNTKWPLLFTLAFIFFHHSSLAGPNRPKPILGPLFRNHCSIHELGPRVATELSEFMKTAYYDRSVYYLETSMNPLDEIHQTLDPYPDGNPFNSLRAYEKYGTGNCVGLSRSLEKTLNQTLPATFQVISSSLPKPMRQPNMPEYPHAALVAQCTDGYILVDPSLNIPVPVLLPALLPSSLSSVNNASPVYVDLKSRGTLRFELDSVKKQIHVQAHSSSSEIGSLSAERIADSKYDYLLFEIKNPDEAITSVHFLNDRKILIYPLTLPDEPAYRMVIQLVKKQIEYTTTDANGVVTQRFTFPFAHYIQNPNSLPDILTEQVANELRIPRSLLLTRVENVLKRVTQ